MPDQALVGPVINQVERTGLGPLYLEPLNPDALAL
jgi:hypothetical protein